MTKYRVEIDDGDGNIEWIEVDALDENEAVDAATKKLSDLKPEADPDLMVAITIETGQKNSVTISSSSEVVD